MVNLKKYTQSGRSMIEMLGVLAIVGVLSAGGIAGYSSAMSEYKANKVVEQFAYIQHSLQKLHSKQQTYGSIDDSSALEVAIELDVFPDSMVQTVGGNKVVRHAGGGTVSLSFGYDDVSVTFNDLQRDAAIALLTTDFSSNWVKSKKSN